MFTGLILELGEVVSLEKRTDGAKLSVKASDIIKDAAIGDSISVNGVCLTVTEMRSSTSELFFDVSYETLKSTNLGGIKRGDKVNLEPSLRPNSKMGGHFVTGHIDGIGRIIRKTSIGNAIKIDIEAPENIIRYLVEKGSVAVDGVSLTVVNVFRDAFNVVVIPHTAKMTTIGLKDIGETVNIEPDILAKYVERFLQKEKDLSIISTLKKSGFI